MYKVWLGMGLAAILVAAFPVNLHGDWKDKAAKKAVGNVVQEGIEEGMEDAMKDAALDAVSPDSIKEANSKIKDIDKYDAVGATAGEGMETAFRTADVASKLDDAADTAKAVNKIRKVPH